MFLFPFDRVLAECEKNLTKPERIKQIEKMLQEDFPLCFYIFNSVFNILFGIAAIGFQVASLLLKSPLYYIFSG